MGLYPPKAKLASPGVNALNGSITLSVWVCSYCSTAVAFSPVHCPVRRIAYSSASMTFLPS